MTKVKKYRAQMAHKSVGVSGGVARIYLLSGAQDGKELLGSSLFNRLDQHCWKILKAGGYALSTDMTTLSTSAPVTSLSAYEFR